MLREIWNEISPRCQSEHETQSRGSSLSTELVLWGHNFPKVRTESRDCHLLAEPRAAPGTLRNSQAGWKLCMGTL